jgi:O-antigen/teichoic acid export membrane protein
LDSFSVFLVLALGWIAAGLGFGRRLQLRSVRQSFLDLEPRYWHEHWKYTRWVLATALVVQFTTQGYYWLVAAFVSVKEVAELRSMYLLVAPVDQVFIALYFLVLPALASRYATSGKKGFLSLWKRYALLTVSLTALFAVVVRVVGRPVIHLLYAGKFDGAVPILFILALLPLVMGIGNTVNDAIKAAERPKLAFYGYACSAAATFLLGIPLVSHFGLRGAAYGMLLSGATYSAALTVLFFLRIYKHELQRAQ